VVAEFPVPVAAFALSLFAAFSTLALAFGVFVALCVVVPVAVLLTPVVFSSLSVYLLTAFSAVLFAVCLVAAPVAPVAACSAALCVVVPKPNAAPPSTKRSCIWRSLNGQWSALAGHYS
jgi:hypothetical protein